MTIDTTKITPEKLAEMNDALIVDNTYLRDTVGTLKATLTVVQGFLNRVNHWQEGKPDLHDIKELVKGALK